jgi:GTP-binding protein
MSRAHLSFAFRSVAKDEKVYLAPPKKRSVEEYIGYMGTDEIIEVTPLRVTLRKQLLDAGERERAQRTIKKQLKELKK